MVSDQPGELDVSQTHQVAGSVKGMEAGDGEFRRIADVVQPGRRLQQLSLLRGKVLSDPACLVSNCLHVQPTVSERSQQLASKSPRPASRLHESRLAGTTDTQSSPAHLRG